MLNAIGLQNPGIDVFMERDIPFLKKYDTKIIVNVCGKSVEDYVDVVERLGDEPAVSMLEINVSCPNVKEGAIAFGQKADALYNITSELKNMQTAHHHEAEPQCDRHYGNGESGRGSRCGCTVSDQHHHRHEDRHSPQEVRHCQQDRRHERSCHQTHCVRMVYQVAQAVKIPIIGMAASLRRKMPSNSFWREQCSQCGRHELRGSLYDGKVVEGIEDYMRHLIT